jgi:hypothetical protein
MQYTVKKKKRKRNVGHSGTLVIPTLGRLTQENQEFEAYLGYIGRPFLKDKKRKGEWKRIKRALGIYKYGNR